MTANEKNQAPAGTEDVSNDPPHIDRKSHIETAIQQERTQQWEQASYHFNQNSPSRPTTPMKNATSESTNDPIASIHATLDPDPVALLQKPDDATRASPLASDDLTPDTDYKGLTEEERDSNAAMRAAKLRMYTYNRVSGSAPASLERYLGEGSTTEGSVEGRVSLRDRGIPEASMEHSERRESLARDAASLSRRGGQFVSSKAMARNVRGRKRNCSDDREGGCKRKRP